MLLCFTTAALIFITSYMVKVGYICVDGPVLC